jgi:hypothetical protein
MEQHLMLQYLAVALCTGSPQPTRAQIRYGNERPLELFDTPATDATGGVYAAGLSVCQLLCRAFLHDAARRV